MSYDLQAEGINGTQAQTSVGALPTFPSEFNISVWHVDATQAPAIDAIHGYTAKGATGVVGVSNGEGSVGVLGNAHTATTEPGFTATGATGVVGLSDANGVGVRGQAGTGVSGLGSNVGGYFQTNPQPGHRSTGVIGLSDANGIGVIGRAGTGVPSQSGTGVLGTGNTYGGVFHTTPQPGEETYANIQLTPVNPGFQKMGYTQVPEEVVAPKLPNKGTIGDVLATIVPNDPVGVRLWVCIKPADPKRGATWARVSFDVAIVTDKG